jgi:hypothetical protein
VTNENNSNNKQIVSVTTITEPLASTRKIEQQIQDEKEDHSHKGENPHSKNTEEEELEKSHREQQILLKENKNYIINFLLSNKDSIRIDDLKIYELVYKCYREKDRCFYCNTLTNIICINCSNYSDNKKVWLCVYHWKQHRIDNHCPA